MVDVLISELKIGMTLAEDVRNNMGRLLLIKNSKLTEKHIRILKIWGINQIKIEMNEQIQMTKIPEKWEKIITSQFSKIDNDNKISQKLKHILLHFYQTIEEKNIFMPIRQLNHIDLSQIKFEIEKIDLRKISHSISDLMTFSKIYYEILDVINDPKSTMTQLSEVVSKDPNLTVKILRIVNSSIYGLSTQIESIQKAVTLLGTQEISQLVIGITVINQFSSIDPDFMDMKKFWLHSIATGIIASLIAIELGYEKHDRFFLGGLLHDIGFLLLLKNFPQATGAAMQLAIEKSLPQSEAERQIFHTDHCEISEEFFEGINFPDIIKEMIFFHHNPSKSHFEKETRIICCSDTFARLLLYSPYPQVYLVDYQQDEFIKTNIEISSLYKIFLQAAQEINETSEYFYP